MPQSKDLLATAATREALMTYADSLRPPGRQFPMADVVQALRDHDASLIHAAISYHLSHGSLCQSRAGSGIAVYWARQPGQPHVWERVRSRSPGGRMARQAPPPQVVIPPPPSAPVQMPAPDPVDIAPCRVQIFPPTDRLTDAALFGVLAKLAITVSGGSIFVEYGSTNLTIRI